MRKKAQVNQIFVYILSTIVVLFVGFLVVKFAGAFTSDSSDVFEQKFFDTLEGDYLKVFRTYNAEQILDYKVQSKVESVRFVDSSDCANTLDNTGELGVVYQGGDNIVIYTENGIESSYKLGVFHGCFEVIPDSNGRFTLAIENVRNEVYIEVA